MKIVIIGSGMSGLTAGAYLARGGHAVTIYEQFPTPGGVTATVKQDGFGWDIGPLLLEGFSPGDKARLILEELGVSDLVPVVHAQIAGVSYKNLGDAGVQFLSEWADEGARVRVPTTLNPMGMERGKWQGWGIQPSFATPQLSVII